MSHPTHTNPKRRSVLAMLGAVPLAVAGTAHADSSSSPSGRGSDELRPGGELDRYVDRQAAEDTFSGTVLVTYRDKPLLSRSYGWADKERRIRNGPDTMFVLGSVPKVFTGIAIAQLVQAGKVGYHEKVGTYLDGFAPEVADHVTVHQLLTHSSGLGDFHRIEGFWDREGRRIAHPYAEPPEGGGRVDVLERNLLVGTPAGGAFVSAPDLARFAKAFQDNVLLEAAHTYLVASNNPGDRRSRCWAPLRSWSRGPPTRALPRPLRPRHPLRPVAYQTSCGPVASSTVTSPGWPPRTSSPEPSY